MDALLPNPWWVWLSVEPLVHISLIQVIQPSVEPLDRPNLAEIFKLVGLSINQYNTVNVVDDKADLVEKLCTSSMRGDNSYIDFKDFAFRNSIKLTH